MAAVIVITVTVIIAQCSRLTSMITSANRSAAVIIVNRRRDHELVIIAPVFLEWYEKSVVQRVRKIHGWYEKSLVRNVYGTNSLWYEKSGSLS